MKPILFTPPRPYIPVRAFHNPHLQTIWGGLAPRPERLNWKATPVETEDGDVIGVYLTPGQPNAPLVFFVHGLEGSISAPMIRGVGTALGRLGWRVGALALRGCAIPNRKPRAYCAADSPDVQAALAYCCREAQPRSVHTVGLSLGGNILAHWLIHHAAEGKSPDIPLRSAALIGSPHHLATSVVFTEEALYGFYQWNL
ncbi:MAG: alpha/beta fold hydrolase, partial [Candidatus Sumerlaeia bacterium]|nr:alpha/beta fold hydrolase [Candidatus Sumerlaeia bacterium]